MSAAAMGTIDIQVTVEAGDWPAEEALYETATRVLGAANAYLSTELHQPFPAMSPELSLLFTNDAAMRTINAEWRDKDKATNVLSFPAFPLVPGGMPGPMLGDIVLASETIANEAKDLQRSSGDHLAHLLVHGYLHLFGYDHIEAEDAEIMEHHEIRILATLGISDPYEGQSLLDTTKRQ